jgi:endonuclease/exonuclease/phosphatase family metal-dependent hydrolase
MLYNKKLFYTFILLLFTNLAIGEPLYVGSFNINSGRSSALLIARQMASQDQIELWGISESDHEWPSKILTIINQNKNYAVIRGTTGINKNLLQIYYDTNKFHLIAHTELDEINPNKKVRAPLLAHLRNKTTGKELLFMVNHLYRADSDARLLQAKKINAWVKKQTLPVIAVGDYNFDLSPYNPADHGEGFDAITQDNILQWIEPSILLPSQCSKYNSILDFIFISNKVVYTAANSDILYPETSYCEYNKNSDHRPVIGMIDLQ